MFKLDTIVKKISFGYILLAAVLMTSVAMSTWQHNQAQEVSEALRDEHLPISQATLTLLNGVNQSLANLRGWLILKDDAFRDEREKVWDNTIHPNLHALKKVSSNRNDREYVNSLTIIENKLKTLEKVQEEIENISTSRSNTPGVVLFDEQIKPRLDLLNIALDELIQSLDQKIMSGTRDETVFIHEIYKNTFSLFLNTKNLTNNVQNYIFTGAESARKAYLNDSQKTEYFVNELLAGVDTAPKDIKSTINKIRGLQAALPPMLDEVVNMRQQNEWNIALYWLVTRAIPVANEIIDLLEQNQKSAALIILQDFEQAEQQSDLLGIISWTFIIIGLVACAILCLVNAKTVAMPIRRMIDIAKDVSNGSLSVAPDLKGTREIEVLDTALNNMVYTLRSITETAESISQGYLDIKFETKGRDDVLGNALKTMVNTLKKTKEESEQRFNELVASEMRANSIISNMKDGLVNIDAEGCITLFNPSAEKIFQYSSHEVIGCNIKMLVPAPHSNRHDRYLENYLDSGDRRFIGLSREVLAQRKDGSTFPASIVVTEINVNGKKNFIGTVRDCTNEKLIEHKEHEAKAALEAEKEKLIEQDWLKSSYTGITEKIQSEKTIKTMARTLLQELIPVISADMGMFYIRTGLDQEEFEELESHQTLSLLSSYAASSKNIEQKSYQFGEGLIGQAALNKKTVSIQPNNQDRHNIDGGFMQHVPAEVVASPIVFENEVLAILEVSSLNPMSKLKRELLTMLVVNLGMFINTIVGRSRTEQLLRRYQAQASKLKHREFELQRLNQDLEHKTEAAQQANKAKSEFLANMSHELRTPLNSLLILASSLAENKSGNLMDTDQEAAKVIYQSGNDLLVLINDILDLAKIEAGRILVNAEEFKINDLANDLQAQFKHVASSKSLHFEICLDDHLPQTVYSDIQRVSQVLKNLLSNAIKFTHQGKITLTAKQIDSDTLVFCVSDTGIGIPKNRLESIFEAFEQVDKSTSRHYGGTGLGLSISKELAHMLGGELSVRSDYNNGSEFTFTLPIRYKTSTPEQTVVQSEKIPTGTALDADIKQLRMARKASHIKEIEDDRDRIGEDDKVALIVDDDIAFAKIVRNRAQQEGFKCLISETGKQGIQFAGKYTPTVIILDIDLPDITGLEVFDKLLENESTSNIPVYFMSVYDDSREAMKRGARGYVTKPIKPEHLNKLIESIHDLETHPPLVSTRDTVTQVNTEDAEQNRILSDKRILLVDDDTRNLFALSVLLKRMNMVILMAGNGAKALEVLNSEDPIDLVLMDIMMPVMDGYTAIEKIREQPQFDRLPIIAVTAKAMKEDREKCLAIGASDYLPKPIDTTDLIRMMTEWLVKNETTA